MFEKSGRHRCLHLRNAGISHAHPLEPNRAITGDRCHDGRLALDLVQGSGISTRILTAQYLHLSFARDGRLSDPSRKDTHSVTTSERRKVVRVVFEKGIEVSIMAIDGTWRRDCIMQDVSETGARLSVRDSIEGLKLKDFFLLLSSTGLTYRRCELAWVNGEEIGAKFVTAQTEKKKRTGRFHNNNLEV